MKRDKKIIFMIVSSITIPIIAIAILLTLNPHGGMCMGKEAKKEKVDYMKVEFFKVEEGTEKSIGTAEWKSGKVIINVTDTKLDKILKSPFSTTKGEMEGDKHVLYLVELKPGTLEHLQAVALEARGYIGIISYGEKK